jgi:transcriptional regulator with XRE-family HTH domain
MAHNISKNLSFIGQNIKKIRQAKKISQAQFAAQFKLARPSVGAYEEGRSEPKIDTIIQIANYFSISIDVLLTRELSVSEIYSFDLVKEKLDKAHNLKKQARQAVSIGIVRNDQYLDYIVNFENRDYLKNLEQIGIPETGNANDRAFEIMGSEMEFQLQGLHHGDVLIGKRIQPKELKKQSGKILTVIHKANITTRRLKSIDKSNLILSADDPNYPELIINRNEILETWVINAVFSKQLNAPIRLEERMLKLEEALKKMGE